MRHADIRSTFNIYVDVVTNEMAQQGMRRLLSRCAEKVD